MRAINNLIFTLIAIGFLTSCLESDLATTDKNSDSDLNYLDPTQDRNNYPNDPYRIIGISPRGDFWDVIVEYSGGCESHNFYTWWDGAPNEEAVSFYFFHNSNGDACEALVRDTISLDMPQVISDESTLSNATISLINANTLRRIPVDPELAGIDQGSWCSHQTSLLGTSCGEGIWDNQWMLMNEALPGHEKIWLQPVSNSTQVNLRKPETDRYLIGVTLLFGYQYSTADGNCQSLPEGSIVPIAINCLEVRD